MGRPSKLTQEVSDKICAAVRAGNYIETAAAYAGVSRTTLYEWMRRGSRSEGETFVAFSVSLDQALATAEASAVATVTAASKLHWQAAAWRLERMYPQRWGQNRLTENAKRKQLKAETKAIAEGQSTALLFMPRIVTERDLSDGTPGRLAPAGLPPESSAVQIPRDDG